jgi:hypothetical protein
MPPPAADALRRLLLLPCAACRRCLAPPLRVAVPVQSHRRCRLGRRPRLVASPGRLAPPRACRSRRLLAPPRTCAAAAIVGLARVREALDWGRFGRHGIGGRGRCVSVCFFNRNNHGPTRQIQVGMQVDVQVESVPPTDYWAPQHVAHLSLTSRLKYLVQKVTLRRSVKKNYHGWTAEMLSGGRSDGPC